MTERTAGPFTLLTGPATRRRTPRVGINRAGGADGEYRVGVWASWLGRQIAVCRSKWWLRQATWRNQLACRVRGHREVRVATKAAVDTRGDATAVVITEDRIDCGRCGTTVRGPQWVTR